MDLVVRCQDILCPTSVPVYPDGVVDSSCFAEVWGTRVAKFADLAPTVKIEQDVLMKIAFVYIEKTHY